MHRWVSRAQGAALPGAGEPGRDLWRIAIERQYIGMALGFEFKQQRQPVGWNFDVGVEKGQPIAAGRSCTAVAQGTDMQPRQAQHMRTEAAGDFRALVA
ncbi:hypothetical protein D3C76_672580 [compost metagenome]